MAGSLVASHPRFVLVLLAGTLVSFLGCDSGPKVYPAKGKVVNKGKGNAADLAGYSVQFQSLSDPAEAPGGPIDEDGTFTMYTRWGGRVVPGVKEGTYQACFTPPAVEGGKPPPLVIPKRYMRLETAKLQYTITPGPNDITIEIERNGR